jgi:hypothetical protein
MIVPKSLITINYCTNIFIFLTIVKKTKAEFEKLSFCFLTYGD